MSIANKYNKAAGFDFKVPEDFVYHSLDELYKSNGEETVYTVKALYINKKSAYGDSPVIATDKCLVNIPSHMLETFKEMILDEEVHEACNNNKLGFTIYTYTTDKRKGNFYSVRWVDL